MVLSPSFARVKVCLHVSQARNKFGGAQGNVAFLGYPDGLDDPGLLEFSLNLSPVCRRLKLSRANTNLCGGKTNPCAQCAAMLASAKPEHEVCLV